MARLVHWLARQVQIQAIAGEGLDQRTVRPLGKVARGIVAVAEVLVQPRCSVRLESLRGDELPDLVVNTPSETTRFHESSPNRQRL